MGTIEYVIPLGTDARKRHYHKTAKGKVTRFIVQLEVRVEEQWKVVLRYDTAHDFAHRDRYRWDGSQEKTELHLDFNEALTVADEDLKENWFTYKQQFLKGQ